jgi:hypothetical protein
VEFSVSKISKTMCPRGWFQVMYKQTKLSFRKLRSSYPESQISNLHQANRDPRLRGDDSLVWAVLNQQPATSNQQPVIPSSQYPRNSLEVSGHSASHRQQPEIRGLRLLLVSPSGLPPSQEHAPAPRACSLFCGDDSLA